MPRLRRATPSEPGLTRRRAGRGWVYLDADGRKVDDPAVVARCRELVIPPAWSDVWICPWPNGHLQAVGTDDAGRRQYLYHPQWRAARDEAKHQRVLDIAARLPEARRAVATHLARGDMSREHVLAAAFRLLDLGLFRVGGESYAADNGSFGLATLRRDHVRVSAEGIVFDYRAKHGQRRRLVLQDEACAEVVRTLKRRRDSSEELLAWRVRDGGRTRWRDVTSGDVNDFVQEVVGPDTTAKDFRTWHATVLAARSLADAGPAEELSRTRRTRTVAGVMREVAEHLGNTPAVARSSYVDPRVVDLWEDGVSIAPVVAALGAEGSADVAPGERTQDAQDALERSVLELLTLPPLKARATLRRTAREVAEGPVHGRRDRSRGAA
ncbi:DNA topoisomerase IB [Aquipuribacter nitratireducens]|uniref:DNA topoisomerase n=1 Tax=Aquipuribacter nitratireducens TaxID=650104 RepID=A0ABW0GIP8_9MICO